MVSISGPRHLKAATVLVPDSGAMSSGTVIECPAMVSWRNLYVLWSTGVLPGDEAGTTTIASVEPE